MWPARRADAAATNPAFGFLRRGAEPWRVWPVVAAALLAAVAGLGMLGQARGGAYGRYNAVPALVERRATVLDGFVDGMRPRAGAPLEDLAYFGGHYYLTEPPLLTWLASPFYAVGSLVAMLWPGVGWTPALVALLSLLLLLATRRWARPVWPSNSGLGRARSAMWSS
jgi:hypothetical protein